MPTATESLTEQILGDVLELPPAERFTAAERAAGGDPGLFRRVMSLLAADSRAGGFMAGADESEEDSTSPPAADARGSGDKIGGYRLIRKIAEGGCGVVFLAEQEIPVRRLVALKITKPGVNPWNVMAQFEAERRAAARMDHPGIAKVLDSGTTAKGRPYLVTELVRGSAVTRYADRRQLSVRDRVALASQICRAMDHAHRRGVVHRDLKPANVMVSTVDGRPVVKVIDFGIAAFTRSVDAGRGLLSDHRGLIGTPQYMAPERAAGDGTDADVRSDVYSLGVVIYELLAGTTPLDAVTLRSAAHETMRQLIRDTHIPPPSARLRAMPAHSQAAIAAGRRTDAATLTRLLLGGLDSVVMKAVEKDRRRRSQTAAALANRLDQFLSAIEIPPADVPAARRRTMHRPAPAPNRHFVTRDRFATVANAVTNSNSRSMNADG